MHDAETSGAAVVSRGLNHHYECCESVVLRGHQQKTGCPYTSRTV